MWVYHVIDIPNKAQFLEIGLPLLKNQRKVVISAPIMRGTV